MTLAALHGIYFPNRADPRPVWRDFTPVHPL